ncbi:MAG: LPP20 family lipoprotein [Selenomonadaceae bacterium]|nr:LPP20 family lipoprotein [Selenomonadaceae bacterium]MBR1858160.1 LPP20 family lipoprotein [Selenomonadaceae bacterium]
MKKSLIKMFAAVMTLVTAMVVSSVSAFAADEVYGEVDWSTGTIRVEGYGVMNPKFSAPGQRKLSAIDAAKANAYAQLLAIVKGIKIDAVTNVENYMVEHQGIDTRVSGIVRGAKMIGQPRWEGDICYVVMEMSIYGGSSSLAATVLERPAQQEPIPAPIPNVTASNVSVSVDVSVTQSVSTTQVNRPAARASGNYTGVIIDCRGLPQGQLDRIMSPVIMNQSGQKIYGHKNLNYDLVIEKGMAGYSEGTSSLGRAGSNPLVIKAVALANANAYPVISDADANRMLLENSKSHFLDNLNVVFIR